MAPLTYLLAILLFFLHQDCWLWSSTDLVGGFIPVGLAYHVGFSIAAGLLWAFALRTIWPAEWERWAGEDQ